MTAKTATSDLILIGVGGGGCRLLAGVHALYGASMRVIGVDTDAMMMREMTEKGVPSFLLGGSRLAGCGTGGDQLKGRAAAEDDLEALYKNHLGAVRMAVILTCLGGGTGSGATPIIVKALHEMGIVTLCFAMLPFTFESNERRNLAMRMRTMIEGSADSAVFTPLDTLFKDAGQETVTEAINATQEIVTTGLTLLWNLLSKPGFIKFEKERLRQMVMHGGKAHFGSSTGQGADRANQAVKGLLQRGMLRDGAVLKECSAVMLGIMAGRDLLLSELGEIMDGVRTRCRPGCSIEMGTVIDAQYDGRIEIAVITFERGGLHEPLVAQQTGESGIPLESAPPPIEAAGVLSGLRGGRRKGRGKSVSKLGYGATGRGRFENCEPTIFNGEDKDLPTYLRLGIVLDR